MNTVNQNIVTGLLSIVAMIASLVLTYLSIRKVKYELRELSEKRKKHKTDLKGDSKSNKSDDSSTFPLITESKIDILFFLLFSIGSIDAIIEFLANTVPFFTLVATLFFVPIYSLTLIKYEKGYKLAGLVGLLISSTLWITFGVQRLMPVFSSPSNSTIKMLFSLIVNLSVLPLLLFSLASSQRIIENIKSAATNQNSA